MGLISQVVVIQAYTRALLKAEINNLSSPLAAIYAANPNPATNGASATAIANAIMNVGGVGVAGTGPVPAPDMDARAFWGLVSAVDYSTLGSTTVDLINNLSVNGNFPVGDASFQAKIQQLMSGVSISQSAIANAATIVGNRAQVLFGVVNTPVVNGNEVQQAMLGN